jgi:hypothetical protein
MLYEVRAGDKVRAFDTKTLKDHYVDVLDTIYGEEELWEVEMEDGRLIRASMKHKFLCEDLKMHRLEEILLKKLKIVTD